VALVRRRRRPLPGALRADRPPSALTGRPLRRLEYSLSAPTMIRTLC
jgi:hypothetical protein